MLELWGPRRQEHCAWCRNPLPEDCWDGRFCDRAHSAAASQTAFMRPPALNPRADVPLRLIAVCWWCGGTFPTTTRKSLYRRDTHINAAYEARRKRRQRTAAQRERAGLCPCPNPDKYAYPTLEIAKAVIRGMREQGVPDGHLLVAYRCMCGQVHVGNHNEDLVRRLSAPLDPRLRRERGLDVDGGWVSLSRASPAQRRPRRSDSGGAAADDMAVDQLTDHRKQA